MFWVGPELISTKENVVAGSERDVSGLHCDSFSRGEQKLFRVWKLVLKKVLLVYYVRPPRSGSILCY